MIFVVLAALITLIALTYIVFLRQHADALDSAYRRERALEALRRIHGERP